MKSPAAALPLAAPCRSLQAGAALRWLRLGWRDLRAGLRVSGLYGAVIALLSAGTTLLAWKFGSTALVLAMLSGFVFLAPLLATGLYSVSRQLHRNERPTLRQTLVRMRSALGNALVFALVLIVIFLVWVRAAVMVHVFFPTSGGLGQWLTFLSVGSAVGAIFAAVTFAASAFSLPMIVDRDVDMITACITSVHAVLRNRLALAVWAIAIVVLTVIGIAAAGVGLAIVIPWLGHATWHAYSETIDATAWPPTGPAVSGGTGRPSPQSNQEERGATRADTERGIR